MGADYYTADTENGDHIDDPSEDGLFMLLSGLNQAGNSFITINPGDDDPAWYASVTLPPGGTYDVERADPARGQQHRDTATDPSDIARDLTIWLAARHYPGRPARSNSDFETGPKAAAWHARRTQRSDLREAAVTPYSIMGVGASSEPAAGPGRVR